MRNLENRPYTPTKKDLNPSGFDSSFVRILTGTCLSEVGIGVLVTTESPSRALIGLGLILTGNTVNYLEASRSDRVRGWAENRLRKGKSQKALPQAPEYPQDRI